MKAANNNTVTSGVRNGTALAAAAKKAKASAPVQTKVLQRRNDYGNFTTAELRAMTAPWKLNATRAAAIGAPHLAGKMSICMVSSTPDVFCSPNEPSDTYSGFLLEVFEQVAQRTPWLDYDSWGYCCTNWDELEGSISKPNNPNCTLSLGINPSRERKYRISHAINQQGLLVLTRVVRRDNRGLFRCVCIRHSKHADS
jgi:hypothetical protein